MQYQLGFPIDIEYKIHPNLITYSLKTAFPQFIKEYRYGTYPYEPRKNGDDKTRRSRHLSLCDGYRRNRDSGGRGLQALLIKERIRCYPRWLEIYLELKRVKDLPVLDRPREKALRYGINTLSTKELLALLIGSGGKDNSALDIARNMLDDSRGLFTLANKSIDEFKLYKGVDNARALNLAAIFELAKRLQIKESEENEEIINSDYIYKKYSPRLSGLSQETFVLIILNKRKRIVHEITMFKGNDNQISLSYRNIIKEIVVHNGYYFYIIHNHPSGDLNPSIEDQHFTIELAKRCKEIDVAILDHLIISKDGYYSFLRKAKNWEIN